MSLKLKDLSISGVLKQYSERSKNSENYGDDNGSSSSGNKKTAIAIIIVFLLLIIVMFAVWIWALVAIVKYWHYMPTWARAIGVIGLLPFVPIGCVVTLVLVYATKGKVALD